MIRGRPRGWNLWQGIASDLRPRACIYTTPDLQCSLIPMFSNEDVVAVRVKDICHNGDEYVFVSAYMAGEKPVPPDALRKLLTYTETERTPTIVGTDANAHHTVWGSSNVNNRGEALLEYCMCANLNFCNVGKKPTFRTKQREEVLDLTLVNRNAWDRVYDWHVSDVPSLSDHMYIRFRIKGSILKRKKMIRNIRRTCWDKYAEELDRRLNEQDLVSVSISSKEEVENLATELHSIIITSYEASCPLHRVRRRYENFWWNSELADLRRKARKAFRKAIRTKHNEDWEAQKASPVTL